MFPLLILLVTYSFLTEFKFGKALFNTAPIKKKTKTQFPYRLDFKNGFRYFWKDTLTGCLFKGLLEASSNRRS